MARETEARSIHLILSGIAIVALLTWGTYAILFVSTSPSDTGSTINEVLNRESQSFANTVGTVMRPGSGAQYILTFQANIPGGIAPSGHSLPGGGYDFGPLLWTPPSSTAASFQVKYAVFTYAFSFTPGPMGCCPLWFTGPQGNISSSMGTSSYGGLNFFVGQSVGAVRFGWETSILEVDSVGNYTLHFFNKGDAGGNATGQVAMGASAVVFSRSQPYLYPGVTTEAVALALVVMTALVLWRRPKHATPT